MTYWAGWKDDGDGDRYPYECRKCGCEMVEPGACDECEREAEEERYQDAMDNLDRDFGRGYYRDDR